MEVAIFQFQMFGINTYVVFDTDTSDCVIVDPGMSDKREERAMTEFITRNNLRVTGVINTHLHIDHVVGNDFASSGFSAPVMAHKDDEPLGERVKEQARMFGMGDDFKNVKVDRYLEDNEIIKVGNGELQVICVPGHSRGSIALYDKQDSFVIVGDALFQRSIGRTDLPGGNHAQLLDSIRQRLFTLPDETVVYPGHGAPTTIGEEKRSNPFLS